MTGKLLGKRYELMERIDSGGMADIYKALCKKTNNIVAIKILKDKFSNNPEYIDRFKKEASSVFALEHPNIVRVTDIGNEDGVYYMVMEYVEGVTLKALIDKKTFIPEEEAIRYAVQVCSALSLAHSCGIIHRDIKPQNILIDKDGNVKLTDFGIAMSLSAHQEHSKQIIGSVYYISPEQARGEVIDSSTDIYSLGIVLYEMLTGKLPHTGKAVSVALKHINEQIVPPKEVKNDLSKAISCAVLKATFKDKEDRYKTIDDFKNDLILSIADPDGTFIDIPPYYLTAGDKTTSRKKINLLWKIGILILLIGLTAFIVVMALFVFNTSNQKNVLVPNLIGMDIKTMREKTIGFQINTTYEQSESYTQGVVMFQSPAGGSYEAAGGQINIIISDGPDALEMPDFSGVSIEDAKAMIRSMGLKIADSDITYEQNENVPPGNIISQVPDADTAITESDIISLVVSKDNTDAGSSMPSLDGKTLADAVGFLYNKGYTNCFVYQDDSEKKEGTVINQSPNVGEKAQYNDGIFITVSRYKQQKYKGSIVTTLNITEDKSSVFVVIQDYIGSNIVNYVVKTLPPQDSGQYALNTDLTFMTGGKKTVLVYVNKIEAYSAEVKLVE